MSEQRPGVTPIVPCNDIDAAEAWWARLGFTRPADQGYHDYRMLADETGAAVHLNPAYDDWLVPGRNPFGVYVYTRRVDAIAETMRPEILEREKAPTHKEWGMYEFALNGPDGLLVRIGWPTVLVRGD